MFPLRTPIGVPDVTRELAVAEVSLDSTSADAAVVAATNSLYEVMVSLGGSNA
jgi:hypothetical protein